MDSYFRSKNLLKSFYYYNLNKMKAWQSDDKEKKIGVLVISVFLFIQFVLMIFLVSSVDLDTLLIYLPFLVLIAFLLINFIIYFLAGKYSKIYDIYRIDLDGESVSFFNKNGEIKQIYFEDISKIEYRFIKRKDSVKFFSTFSNYFKIEIKNGESIAIPLDICKLDSLIEKIKKESNIIK